MLTRTVIEDLWRSLVNWYIVRSRYWSRLSKLAKESGIKWEKTLLDRAYGLWGHVWHEHDLVMLFSHRLLTYIEERNLNMHLHVDYELKPGNFSTMAGFHSNLSEAVKSLRSILGFNEKWFPEIDLIITEDEPPFLYCLEFKYYHYLPTTWSILEDLGRKATILKTLKDHAVCRDAGILLLDDGVCRRNNELCRGIRSILSNASSYLLVLAHYVSYDELIAILEKWL